MAEREARARKAVEYAPEHDAQRVRAGLERPLPGGPAQPIVSVQYGRGRDRVGRMQVDQRVQSLRALPERVERAIVEILSIGMPVDHGAAEFELAHAAFELVRGGGGVLHGKMREAGVALRALVDLAC